MPNVTAPTMAPWRESIVTALGRLEAVAPVVVVGPTPLFPYNAEACLGTAFFSPQDCSLPYEQAVPPDTRAVVAGFAESAGAELLDLNGILCTADGLCPMIAGDTIMYRDAGHISNAYSTHFATVFGDALSPYLR
jgi:hypothetical protein